MFNALQPTESIGGRELAGAGRGSHSCGHHTLAPGRSLRTLALTEKLKGPPPRAAGPGFTGTGIRGRSHPPSLSRRRRRRRPAVT